MPTELHLRAARHHEAAGDHREAIDHALAARDFDDAGRLIERAAPRLWTSGEAQSVQAWLAALPDAVLWRKAGLVLDSTLRFLESLSWTTEANYARGMTLVEPLLGRLRALMRDSPADAGAIAARLRLLGGLLEARSLLRDSDQGRMAQVVDELEGLARPQPVSWWTPRCSRRQECQPCCSVRRGPGPMSPRSGPTSSRSRGWRGSWSRRRPGSGGRGGLPAAAGDPCRVGRALERRHTEDADHGTQGQQGHREAPAHHLLEHGQQADRGHGEEKAE